MDDIKNLRRHFTPSQPTVGLYHPEVSYQELLPARDLQPYIYCYWTLQTKTTLEVDYLYRVVADGCIDVFVELSAPSESFVMGFCKKYTEFALGTDFHYVGIRFLPSIFPQVFGVHAKDLSDQSQELSHISADLSDYLASECNRDMTAEEITFTFDRYLSKIFPSVSWNDDPRFDEALMHILTSQGVIQIEQEIKTGLSPRQLRRKFDQFIGTSPKTFSKVVRFQNILRSKPSSKSLRYNHLFFDGGYFDQSHFIKEFKQLYGVSPSKAFRRSEA